MGAMAMIWLSLMAQAQALTAFAVLQWAILSFSFSVPKNTVQGKFSTIVQQKIDLHLSLNIQSKKIDKTGPAKRRSCREGPRSCNALD